MLRSREVLATLATNPLSWRRSVSVPWILALVASKAGDLATTVAGYRVLLVVAGVVAILGGGGYLLLSR